MAEMNATQAIDKEIEAAEQRLQILKQARALVAAGTSTVQPAAPGVRPQPAPNERGKHIKRDWGQRGAAWQKLRPYVQSFIEEARWSRRQLAAELGVSTVSVHNWMGNGNPPGWRNLDKLDKLIRGSDSDPGHAAAP